MRNQKGITLIALIITIIVMLILVAVTVSVALNGGIFNNARDAKTQTNLAKEKEILQTTALGYLNSNGDVDLSTFASEKNGLEGYTLEASTNYVTASNGTNTFYITKQGGLTNQAPQAQLQPQDSNEPEEPENPDEEITYDIEVRSFNNIAWDDLKLDDGTYLINIGNNSFLIFDIEDYEPLYPYIYADSSDFDYTEYLDIAPSFSGDLSWSNFSWAWAPPPVYNIEDAEPPIDFETVEFKNVTTYSTGGMYDDTQYLSLDNSQLEQIISIKIHNN